MPDYSSAPNCSVDATFIDMCQNNTPHKQTQKYKKDMRKIRRKFICSKCGIYPGDDQWSLGTWDNGPYTCFDCS